MRSNIEREITALCHLSPAQLRVKYREAFGEDSRSGNKDLLIKRIAWRMQSLAEGGLSDRAKQRAMELACDADTLHCIFAGNVAFAILFSDTSNAD